MKEMKREKVNLPEMKRKNVASRKASFGVILACIGVMIATVAQGIKLDKEDEQLEEQEETEDQAE